MGTYIYLVPSENRPLEGYTLADGEENFNVKLKKVKGGVGFRWRADLVRAASIFAGEQGKAQDLPKPAKEYEKALPFLEYMDQPARQKRLSFRAQTDDFAHDVLPGLEEGQS